MPVGMLHVSVYINHDWGITTEHSQGPTEHVYETGLAE